MSVKRHYVTSAVIVAAAMVISACGGSGHATSGTSASDGPQENGINTSLALGDNLASDGTPVKGQTLTVGINTDPTSFDDTAGGVNYPASEIYSSLMQLDANGQPQPLLAKSMTTSDNGVTWKIALRQGVTFTDGTPLNAAAVIYNIQRQADTPTSPGYRLVSPIKSMRAVNDLTVQIVLKKAVGSFPVDFTLEFSDGSLGIVASPTAIKKEGSNYGQKPVGAGPFELSSWVPGSQVVLKRNPNYWQKGLPYLNEIVYKVIQDDSSRYEALTNGDIDLMVAENQPLLLEGSRNSSLKTYYGAGIGGTYVILNTAKPPFNDARVRQAAAAAINPQEMSKALFGGVGIEVKSPVATTSPFYSPQAASKFPNYDPALAKKLIQEYVANGGNPSFTYVSSNSQADTQMDEFLQAQWQAVGLKVSVQTYAQNQYTSSIVRGSSFQAGGWDGKSSGNPYPILFNTLDSQGNQNYSHYSNPQVDTLFDAAIATDDTATRISDYQKIQEIVSKDIPDIWISPSYVGELAKSTVHGFAKDIGRNMYFDTTWLAG